MASASGGREQHLPLDEILYGVHRAREHEQGGRRACLGGPCASSGLEAEGARRCRHRSGRAPGTAAPAAAMTTSVEAKSEAAAAAAPRAAKRAAWESRAQITRAASAAAKTARAAVAGDMAQTPVAGGVTRAAAVTRLQGDTAVTKPPAGAGGAGLRGPCVAALTWQGPDQAATPGAGPVPRGPGGAWSDVWTARGPSAVWSPSITQFP